MEPQDLDTGQPAQSRADISDLLNIVVIVGRNRRLVLARARSGPIAVVRDPTNSEHRSSSAPAGVPRGAVADRPRDISFRHLETLALASFHSLKARAISRGGQVRGDKRQNRKRENWKTSRTDSAILRPPASQFQLGAALHWRSWMVC